MRVFLSVFKHIVTMIITDKVIIVLILICTINANAFGQYENQASLVTINSSRLAKEGDMYLDTINNDYRIGLSHGVLAYLTDNQKIDSLTLANDTISIYVERSSVARVSVSGFGSPGGTLGDIKASLKVTDHGGWYLMDGRALTSLPTNAQINAGSLGIVGVLPDATNRVLKTKTGVEALLSIGGNDSITLTQTNLPSYNLGTSVLTSNTGSHTHTTTLDPDGEHDHTATTNNFGIDYKGFANSASNTDTSLIVGNSNVFKTDTAGQHIHNVTINSSGAHTHTFNSINSGGSDQPIPLQKPYFAVNRFIYLGQ